MPYIPEAHRRSMERGWPASNAGELTYELTQVVLSYLNRCAVEVGPKFGDYAEAIAALECTKLEMYRRSVAPYEDTKIAENGDLEYPHGG